MNDQELYEKALELDEEALTAVYDRFSPALYKYSLRSCHDPTVAENIVGDVFGQLVEQLATGSTPTINLRTYLYKTAYQLLLNYSRANPQHILFEISVSTYESEQFAATSARTEERITLEALVSAMNTELTYEERHVMVLRFLDDFSLKETSEIIGEEVNNIAVIQNTAIAKLRKQLGLNKGWKYLLNIDTFWSILRRILINITYFLPNKKTKSIEEYQPKETKLYVGNLPYDMEPAGLLNLFSKAGKVKSVQIFKETERGQLANFAYVEMSTQAEAISAMYIFHRKKFDGRPLAVKIGEKGEEESVDEDLSVGSIDLNQRRLRVFLCHAHKDALAVQAVYKRLENSNIDAWLDKEKLLPGSDWEYEIREAVRASDIVIVCLSEGFDQKGFRQKEVRIALEESAMQPEGEIFIIPARLEECEILPSLRHLHWVNLFDSDGYEKLMRTFEKRARKIGVTL